MKAYRHALPFTRKKHWAWPEGDTKLVQVFDHVSDIEHFMPYVKTAGVCVQAGGACGVWPYRFAQLFERVYTFEPHHDNWECLLENIAGMDNITAAHAPLSCGINRYRIRNDMAERENWGAGYCVPDDTGLKSVAIDSLGLEQCDLIQLDIEGFELNALKGAKDTIDKFRPAIVLEEKPLNHVKGDHTAPRKWLEKTFGYQLISQIHRDVILTC